MQNGKEAAIVSGTLSAGRALLICTPQGTNARGEQVDAVFVLEQQ